MRVRPVAFGLAVLLVLAACSNAKSSSGGSTASAPGVTATEIRVGGLAAITGPLGDQYEPIFKGVQAYIDMVNEQGGVNGRRIRLVAKRDDATNPSRNLAQARALVEEDKVFAVLGVASPIFTGGRYLADNRVPTFGWNVNPEWAQGDALFGEKGSYLNFKHPGPELPYIATRVGAKKVGVVAYTAVQSADCADGQVNGYKKYGLDVVLKDTSLPFGVTDISADIQRLRQAGVQFVGTCMDPTGNTLLSRSLKQFGLNDVKQYWPNGYDQDTLSKFADLMEGVYFTSDFVPFEAASQSAGMRTFLDQMHRRFPDQQISEVVLAGWVNADLFVTALRDVGKNVTRQKLIADINKKRDWTAHGTFSPIDWTIAHHANSPLDCTAFIQVQHGKFVPVFGNATSPFVCWKLDQATLDPVPSPKFSS